VQKNVVLKPITIKRLRVGGMGEIGSEINVATGANFAGEAKKQVNGTNETVPWRRF
jgi:hypothetical protein